MALSPADLGETTGNWLGRCQFPQRNVSYLNAQLDVITKEIDTSGWLIAGVPARPVKELSAEDQFLIERKTRPDLPDDV
jgi:hypothetical protein